ILIQSFRHILDEIAGIGDEFGSHWIIQDEIPQRLRALADVELFMGDGELLFIRIGDAGGIGQKRHKMHGGWPAIMLKHAVAKLSQFMDPLSVDEWHKNM